MLSLFLSLLPPLQTPMSILPLDLYSATLTHSITIAPLTWHVCKWLFPVNKDYHRVKTYWQFVILPINVFLIYQITSLLFTVRVILHFPPYFCKICTSILFFSMWFFMWNLGHNFLKVPVNHIIIHLAIIYYNILLCV